MLEKEVEVIEVYIGSLQKKLVATNQERKEAIKHLIKL